MPQKVQTFLSMDLGGTKLLIGEVNKKGEILQSKRYSTGYNNQDQIITAIYEALDDYIDSCGFVGTPIAGALGLVGSVDYEKGIWLAMDHTKNTNIPLASMLTSRLGFPMLIDNDVRSALTGELIFGYGRNSQNFIYMNVGTGIAASIVSNGKIIRGANHNAGEIGHTVVSADSDVLCSCGRIGCVEALASGKGIAARLKKLLIEGVENTALSLPKDDSDIDIANVFNLAESGDPLCTQILEEAAQALASTIMNLVRASDPDIFILGGGVVSDGKMLKKLQPYLTASAIRGLRHGIVLSSFSAEEVGLIGAGAIAYLYTTNQKGALK